MLELMRARSCLTATLAAVLLAGVTCGGDDQSGGDYRQEANAICSEAERKIEALPIPTSVAELERYLRRALEMSKEYDRKFEALDPPAQLRAEHRRAIRLSRRAERLIEPLVTGGEELSLKKLRRTVPEIERLAGESNALAREMDLPDCVIPLTSPGAPPESS
jgi:hypothetical protein